MACYTIVLIWVFWGGGGNQTVEVKKDNVSLSVDWEKYLEI